MRRPMSVSRHKAIGMAPGPCPHRTLRTFKDAT
jgi:hypothetical protein